MSAERRRDERVDTNLALTCRVPARPRWSIMHDLSHVGCRLEFRETDLRCGGTVVLEVPGARRVAGQIVWTRGKQAGIEFERWLGGLAAVGLDEPEPEPVAEPVAAGSGPNLAGLLPHWVRRLTGPS